MNKIKDLWYNIKYLPRYVSKVVSYSIFLWKDRDYDYCHLMKMMEFKLERMAREIESNDIVVSASATAEQIRHAISASRYFTDDQPSHPLLDNHAAKWGKQKTVMSEAEDGMVKINFVWEKKLTLQQTRDADAELEMAYMKIFEEEERNWIKLWDYYRGNLRRWWD